MKIEGRCRVCGRDFPIDLLVANPETAGRCPFCGVTLDQHYGAMLVDALAGLERAGTAMEKGLEQVSNLGPNLEIDGETVLEPIRRALGERARKSSERKAVEDAAQAEPAR